MKVCFFGSYEPGSYNMLLKKILEKQQIEVIECQENINNFFSLIPAYTKLFFKHLRLNYDVMIIPWRGIMSFPLAKLISKEPIIYIPTISIYDSLILDRQIIKPKSIKAKFIKLVERLGCKWSDMTILDSQVQIEHFIKNFGLERK